MVIKLRIFYKNMSGYEKERFVNISEGEKTELSCGICHEIFRNPVIADCCLQTFCQICIHEWLKNNSSCPYDRKRLSANELRPAPRLLNNLLGKLKIKCDLKGCKEILHLEDLDQHIIDCPFNMKFCSICLCVCKVSHNCVTELLDLNKKENEIIESLRHEKEVFGKLFEDMKTKYIRENEDLINKNKILQKTAENIKLKYESEIQELKEYNKKLQEQLQNQQDNQINSQTTELYRTSSTLSLDSRPTFPNMLREARKYVNQRVTITETNIDEQYSTKIVEIVKNEIRLKNNMYFICQDIVYKLDLELGSSWACISDYDKHGNNYANSSCYIKLKFGKLTFKIYRTRFLDVKLLRRRFREGKIKRQIKVFDTDMFPDIIKFVESITFSTLEKCKTLKSIANNIRMKMESKYVGHWQCFSHSFGDYSINKKDNTFISFEIDEIKLILFQSN